MPWHQLTAAIGVDQAGRERVHTDVERAKLMREVAREADDAALGGDVRRRVARAQQEGHGSEIDDLSMLLFLHHRRDRFATVERRTKVDGEMMIPTLDALLIERLHRIDRGVVDEDVDWAELLRRPLHHRVDSTWIGNVRAEADRLAAGVGDFLCHFRRGRFAQIVDGYRGACLGEGARDLRANPTARAGNESDFSREREPIHASSCGIAARSLQGESRP